MRKLCRWTVLLVATIAMFTALPAVAAVKIGFITTLSGPGAAPGIEELDGFMLAVDLMGGKLGGVPVEVIKKDDQFKPDLGAQIAQELIEKDKVDIVAGVNYSNVMMALYQKVIDSETIFIGVNAGPSPIAGSMCSPYFFSTSWANDSLHENAGEIANLKGYKKIYLMAPNYQAGRDGLTGFKRLFKGEVIDEVYTQMNQPDYSAEIAQLQAAKPDAVYVFYPGAMGVNFVKQYAQAGLMGKIPLLSTATIDSTSLPAIGDVAVGAISASPFEAGLDNPTAKKFSADFYSKYKRWPSFYAAQSYDAAMLLDSALRKTSGDVADKAAMMEALKQADFNSVRGPFRFDNNQFPITDWYMWEVVKDPKDSQLRFAFRGKTLTAHRDAYHDKCPLK